MRPSRRFPQPRKARKGTSKFEDASNTEQVATQQLDAKNLPALLSSLSDDTYSLVTAGIPEGTFLFALPSESTRFTSNAIAPSSRIRPSHQHDSKKHIPRPRNPFFCFRSQFVEANRGRQNNLSKEAALTWSRMSEDEKQAYKDQAVEEKRLHKERYPDYVFKPIRRSGSRIGKRVRRRCALKKSSSSISTNPRDGIFKHRKRSSPKVDNVDDFSDSSLPSILEQDEPLSSLSVPAFTVGSDTSEPALSNATLSAPEDVSGSLDLDSLLLFPMSPVLSVEDQKSCYTLSDMTKSNAHLESDFSEFNDWLNAGCEYRFDLPAQCEQLPSLSAQQMEVFANTAVVDFVGGAMPTQIHTPTYLDDYALTANVLMMDDAWSLPSVWPTLELGHEFGFPSPVGLSALPTCSDALGLGIDDSTSNDYGLKVSDLEDITNPCFDLGRCALDVEDDELAGFSHLL